MDWLYRLCIWISGLAIIIMSIVIPWGVYARKFLNRGAAWPEPIAVFCMVIFTFFGAAACYRAGRHIAVQTLVERLPSSLKRFLPTTVNLLLLLISLFMIYYGFRLCQVTWNQSVDTLPLLRVGVTYLPLPLGSIAFLLFIIEQFVAGSQQTRPIVLLGQEVDQPSQEGRP
jgi:TRAP-type C4-dicarboxylate transport system permease small subunit